MSQLLPLLLIALAGLWWWDAMRAREAAVAASRRACREFGTQFLDDSVVLRRLRLGRDARGARALTRLYSFDFSDHGVGRYTGYVRMVGRHVVDVHLEACDRPPAASSADLEPPRSVRSS